MKKLLITAALLSISTMSAAQDIKWDSLQVSKDKVKIGDSTNFEGSGFGGTMLIAENVMVSTSRRVIDTDLNIYGYSAGLEASQFNLGVGFKSAISESADFFMLVNYVDVKAKASVSSYSFRDSESGKGAQMGFRSMASDNLELTGYINYVDVISSETSVVIGAHYHLNDSFSIGMDYEKDGEERGTSIIARVYL